MNRRIKKKKQKLEALHASKWKYAKLAEKRAHDVYIQTRNCMWGMIPHEGNYASYLRRKRRCGKLQSKITQNMLLAKSFIMKCQSERKEVKKKLFLKEGNCNDG